MTSNPVSPKVWAALIGAGAGTTLSTLLLWLVGASLFDGGWSADRVDNAIAAVPSPLAAFLLLSITAALTFIGGYQTTDPLRVVDGPDDGDGLDATMTVGGALTDQHGDGFTPTD